MVPVDSSAPVDSPSAPADSQAAPRRKRGAKSEQPAGDHLSLLPLGGVGRIGMNAMLLGHHHGPKPTDCDRILLDCGVMFPEDDHFGIDVLLPSLDALRKYKPTIRAIVITHGHEDHIGALPHVLKVLDDIPVYATRFTAGLIQHKLREHGIEDRVDLRLISPAKRIQEGPFDVGFLRVTHSIPDCVSLAIRTPVGNLVFTGDFKIEEGLRDGTSFDEAGFRAFGDEGVLLLMSDSTNSEVPGWSGSEKKVAIALEEVMAPLKGRVIVTLFASNIYRLHSVIDAARKNGRYVVMMGRSLQTYMECANSFTAMPFDKEDLLTPGEMHKYDDDELCIICTGSQGEPRAVLARTAAGTHPDLTLKTTDTVILSSRQIPGNERRIHSMLNDFARQGAHVIYHRNCHAIHVSGHAYADEQQKVLEWVRPKFFFPVHGEYTFLQRHADLGKATGAEQVVVSESGQVVEVRPDRVQIRELVEVHPWYADGLMVGDAETLELRSRQRLGFNGTVAVSLMLRKRDGFVTGTAQVLPYGVYQAKGELAAGLTQALDRWIGALDPKLPAAALEEQLRQAVRRFCKKYTKGKPVVLPFVHWIQDSVGIEDGAGTAETATQREKAKV